MPSASTCTCTDFPIRDWGVDTGTSAATPWPPACSPDPSAMPSASLQTTSMSADRGARRSAGKLAAALVLLFVVSLPLVTVRIYAADELQYYSLLRSAWKDGDLDCRNEYARLLEARPWQTEERRMLVEPSTETGLAPNF